MLRLRVALFPRGRSSRGLNPITALSNQHTFSLHDPLLDLPNVAPNPQPASYRYTITPDKDTVIPFKRELSNLHTISWAAAWR
jgi:hypothetical protein